MWQFTAIFIMVTLCKLLSLSSDTVLDISKLFKLNKIFTINRIFSIAKVERFIRKLKSQVSFAAIIFLR